MLKVRFFVTGVSVKAMEYTSEEINEWIEKTGITIQEIKQNFGQAPTGMSGTMENVLFSSLWYEPKSCGLKGPCRRSTDKILQGAAECDAPKLYIRHTDGSDEEATTQRKTESK
jgi:hypothetical protein